MKINKELNLTPYSILNYNLILIPPRILMPACG